MEKEMRKGKTVICLVCNKPKAPHGRSLPDMYYDTYCTFECEGYYKDPQPDCLFEGEEKDED